ncbi:class I SAM-dependent rRNA methyltransferase [Methylococcus sp. EFPC2]|uniref:class I SAM-dependent rRNA methyltransferase n=1 Tax=Methylococcus sp. EFPC2 TaxID=2812648 RepID=UPI001966F3A6|nr:class I SAM-dependent rRNA methyltransferase [Methylococcus sp. EFPC2]QSA97257.1 class I SAM-dependent rRNA methyltransferase [Methylococcus sp. EFPC2]
MNRLRLKKNEEKRLRAGHLWIFSNEVDTAATPLKGLEPGSLALIEDSRGQALGLAYVNPDTLICARVLTRDVRASVNENFIVRRLETASALRERLFDKPYYRLVHGESDGLPGLVVDRFGDVLSVQTNTAGMERLQPEIFSALEKTFSPRAIVLKNTSSLRQLEGLQKETRLIGGELSGPVEIEENDVKFRIDILGGQKTGWFFDHRSNRALAAKLAGGQRVLDLFSYTGGWGIQAAVAGAASVDCVDGSETALALAGENAELNGVGGRVNSLRADVFDFLKQAREERRRYDLIVLDPPALIKRKKDAKAGVEAYQRLNQGALQLLAPGGILVSASCSYHLQRETLHDLLRASARHGDRHLVFIAQGGQGPDHPVHPAIPETDYLKAYFCSVTPSL